MGASISGVAGLLGAGSSIFGALGGKSNADQVQMPQQFQMPNMGAAAGAAYSGIGNLPATNYGSQFLPQYEQATQNLYNNPYAGQAQQGSIQAGQMGQQGAQNAFNMGGYQSGVGASLVPYAGQIMNTAFDPQQALYARSQQQLQEQVRSGESARGISMSPYGAGLENKAMSDFNIDWQNAQLGRQTQGAGAASGLVGQAGSQIDQGMALQNTGANLYNQASAMPYNTAQGIGQGQQQAISGLFQGGAQAQGLANAPIQDYLQYLGLGNQSNQVANQNAQVGLNQAQLGFNQNQTLGSNLGAGMAGLANQNNWNWLKGMGGGGGGSGGGFAGAFA